MDQLKVRSFYYLNIFHTGYNYPDRQILTMTLIINAAFVEQILQYNRFPDQLYQVHIRRKGRKKFNTKTRLRWILNAG